MGCSDPPSKGVSAPHQCPRANQKTKWVSHQYFRPCIPKFGDALQIRSPSPLAKHVDALALHHFVRLCSVTFQRFNAARSLATLGYRDVSVNVSLTYFERAPHRNDFKRHATCTSKVGQQCNIKARPLRRTTFGMVFAFQFPIFAWNGNRVRGG